MRKALLVGIDNYHTTPLSGCVNDATRMAHILGKHYDGSPNFSCHLLLAPQATVTRSLLREKLELLFRDESDVALLYFSGHGTANNLGGYLVTQDAKKFDEGISMTDVLTLANTSRSREVIIILDCCQSGAFGGVPALANDKAILREGVSVLTATRNSQAAVEIGGEGLFTSLVCDGLEGGAADLVGDISVASLYAFVDQALGPWDQRPLFKAHVSKLLKVRRATPSIAPAVIRQLIDLFKSTDDEYQLDPSYEPSVEPHIAEHERIFGCLQQFNRSGLLVPVGANHMYDAAMNSRPCKLTPRGRFYWRVIASNMI